MHFSYTSYRAYLLPIFPIVLIAFLLGVVTTWIIRYPALPAQASSPSSRQAPLLAFSGTFVTETPTSNPGPSATSPPGCVPWQIVTSPNPSERDNVLYDIAVVTPNDIWAVGYYFNDNNEAQTLTLHWDGTQWSHIPSPSPTQRSYLSGVAAVSSNDVWAVGFYQAPSSSEQTLTMHWDGIAWRVVPSPNPTLGGNTLYDVTALSAGDVWAVGKYPNPMGIVVTLIMRWSGTQWIVVPSPSPGDGISELRGISAISANDIWAVGTYNISTVYHSLMLHWDGTQWVHVPSPDPGPESSEHIMAGIYAISTNDVWAVGSRNPPYTLTLHWDGIAWSKVPSPSPHSQVNYLTGVSGSASNDVWAVGWYGGQALTIHWDGSTWSLVPIENYSQAANRLYDVQAISPNEAWTVGYCQGCLGSGGWYRTLTEHYISPCVTPTAIATDTVTATAFPTLIPSPSPSATTTSSPTSAFATPTPVLTPPTTTTIPTAAASSTAIATGTTVAPTPTICAVAFTDVPPDNTFYAQVMCLACRAIVSGYSDGTFRPNNQVTRGQLAKIVSNAAGFSEPVSGQTFQDVPPTHTFYEFIERLTVRGYMTGYMCGGPGEPCINNRPYFRPQNNATRGQTSKIVANAARIETPIPPDQQTFEDVPPTHTFWLWIERLVTRNVMTGYNCGGPSEPCIAPENRPYFRPGNDVTRGQSAKIVANTFFPGCVMP